MYDNILSWWEEEFFFLLFQDLYSTLKYKERDLRAVLPLLCLHEGFFATYEPQSVNN